MTLYPPMQLEMLETEEEEGARGGSKEREQKAIEAAIALKEKVLEEEVDELLMAVAEKEEKWRKEVEELRVVLGETGREIEQQYQVRGAGWRRGGGRRRD